MGAGVTALVVVALWYFFNRTLQGKAMLATSYNRLAAELVGISTSWVLFLSFVPCRQRWAHWAAS